MKHKPHSHSVPHHAGSPRTLRQIDPGSAARVAGFAAGTASELRERLLAYGLIPGQTLSVIAQRPVTVIQIEHTELALEDTLAACIEIAAAPPGQAAAH